MAAETQDHHQKFCVRWNSHLWSIGASLPQMLANKLFMDVTLVVPNGIQIRCHRVVLASCSDFFQTLLVEHSATEHPIVILPSEIGLWELEALVEYMYKGEVNVSRDGLDDLMRCAQMLQVRGLCGHPEQLSSMVAAAKNSAPLKEGEESDPDAGSVVRPKDGGGVQIISHTTRNESRSVSVTPCRDASSQTQVGETDLLAPRQEQGNPSGSGMYGIAVKSEPESDETAVEMGDTNEMMLEPISINDADLNQEPNGYDVMDSDDDDGGNDPAGGQTSCMKRKSEFALANVTCQYDVDDGSSFDFAIKTEAPEQNVEPHMPQLLFNPLSLMDDIKVEASEDGGDMASGSGAAGGRRIRRSETLLRQAADCVSRGQTFQTVSTMFQIPISTIRFFMARKGILPRRKRGRASGSTMMVDVPLSGSSGLLGRSGISNSYAHNGGHRISRGRGQHAYASQRMPHNTHQSYRHGSGQFHQSPPCIHQNRVSITPQQSQLQIQQNLLTNQNGQSQLQQLQQQQQLPQQQQQQQHQPQQQQPHLPSMATITSHSVQPSEVSSSRSRSSSPIDPPFHFAHYRLPDMKPQLL